MEEPWPSAQHGRVLGTPRATEEKRLFSGSACCEVGEAQHGFACLDLFLSVQTMCGGSAAAVTIS